MKITIRLGKVVATDYLMISVLDIKTKEIHNFHHTSFWSKFPGESLKINDAIDIVCSEEPIAIRTPNV